MVMQLRRAARSAKAPSRQYGQRCGPAARTCPFRAPGRRRGRPPSASWECQCRRDHPPRDCRRLGSRSEPRHAHADSRCRTARHTGGCADTMRFHAAQVGLDQMLGHRIRLARGTALGQEDPSSTRRTSADGSESGPPTGSACSPWAVGRASPPESWSACERQRPPPICDEKRLGGPSGLTNDYVSRDA